MKKRLSIILSLSMVMSAFASFVTAEAADITLDDGTQIQTAADGTLYAEIPAGHPMHTETQASHPKHAVLLPNGSALCSMI